MWPRLYRQQQRYGELKSPLGDIARLCFENFIKTTAVESIAEHSETRWNQFPFSCDSSVGVIPYWKLFNRQPETSGPGKKANRPESAGEKNQCGDPQVLKGPRAMNCQRKTDEKGGENHNKNNLSSQPRRRCGAPGTSQKRLWSPSLTASAQPALVHARFAPHPSLQWKRSQRCSIRRGAGTGSALSAQGSYRAKTCLLVPPEGRRRLKSKAFLCFQKLTLLPPPPTPGLPESRWDSHGEVHEKES